MNNLNDKKEHQTVIEKIPDFFKKIFDALTGRLSAKNFWISAPLLIASIVFLASFESILSYNAYLLFWLVTILPLLIIFLSVFVKRLHDNGKSGLYLIGLLIPFFNFVVLYWITTKGSEKKDNKFGKYTPQKPFLKELLNL